MNKNKKYSKKENKFIIETYNKLKDDQTLKRDVIAVIAQELGRPVQGLEKRVQFLQKIGKIPRNKKPELGVKLGEPITGTAYMDGKDPYKLLMKKYRAGECGYSQNLTIDNPTKPRFMFHDISFLYGVIFACLIMLILWSQYYA